MTFTGWSLVQMATLFAVGGIAITSLYLLRMRRRQVVVPFAALWEQIARESESRRLWRRLRRMVSWLVQLLLLALLCLALGNPKPDAWIRDPRTLALVVDASASMDGMADGGGTRLEAALDRARAEIEAMGPTDRTVVIAAGSEVEVVGALDDEADALLPALDSILARPGEADLAGALTLARHAVAHQPGPRILLLTDGAVSPASATAVQACATGDVPCQVAMIEGSADNVALTAFAARRYPGDREHVEVLAEVRNLGPSQAHVVLDIEADGVRLGGKTLQLAPGAHAREILGNVDAARTRLVARLRPDPARPDDSHVGPEHDDVAYAVVPPLPTLDVVLVSGGGNLFLEAALLTLEENVRLTGLTPEQARQDHPDLERADLLIFDVADHPLPAALPSRDMLVFDPWRQDTGPVPIPAGKAVARPILTEHDQDHPIFANMVLKDINIARGTTFRTEPGDEVLVRTLGEPIVVLRKGPPDVLVVGFDPRQSDFPLRVAFPLFIHNVVDYFEQRHDGFVESIPVGTTRELSLAEIGLPGEGIERVVVTPAEGNAVEIPVDHGVIRFHARHPGFHEIRALDGTSSGRAVEVAVNHGDPSASILDNRLSAAAAIVAASAGPAPAPTPVGGGPLWMTLLLLACGVVALEWISYHRRVTV